MKVIRYRDRDTGELEPIDDFLRRWKKAVVKSEIIYECRKREYFLKKSLEKKRKSEDARKKAKNKKWGR